VIRALFVCSRNRLRSPTAESVFATWDDIETDSAGLDNDAVVPLSSEQVEWADVIFVMEASQRRRLNQKFRRWLNGKRVICLDIPDRFTLMQRELVERLLQTAGPHLR
jgi:predicted protein tyrosine phosphatase